MTKTTKKTMVMIRIDRDLKKRFNKHCDENGYSLSKRLRLLMEKDISGNIK